MRDMNCPYCDEKIHPTSKFCPKCGLPLKEDSTVMGGAYVTDDAGWNPWLVGAGAVGIVVVALGIGWASAHRDNVPVETVQRQATPGYSMPSVGGGMAFGQFQARGFQSTQATSRPVGPAFTPNIPVQWAWRPPPGARVQPRFTPSPPDPTPPPPPLIAVSRILDYHPPSVSAPRPVRPEIPALPPDRKSVV